MPRSGGTCVRCGKERTFAARRMCSPCYVRWRYDNGTPVECARCGTVRLPFSKGLCKSCYQVTRRRPDATVRGSELYHQRLSEAQSHGQNLRERSGKWNGGRFIDATGYVRVLPPEDYLGRKIHGGRYVHEHRLVAEQSLGRPLASGEVVHHVNHDRADNRAENLLVLPSVSAHRRLHVEEERQARLSGG